MILNIQGYDVLIDDEDFERIKEFSWSRASGNRPPITHQPTLDRIKAVKAFFVLPCRRASLSTVYHITLIALCQ